MRGILLATLIVLVLAVCVQSGGILDKHKTKAGLGAADGRIRYRKRGYLNMYRQNVNNRYGGRPGGNHNRGRGRYIKKRHFGSRMYIP